MVEDKNWWPLTNHGGSPELDPLLPLLLLVLEALPKLHNSRKQLYRYLYIT